MLGVVRRTAVDCRTIRHCGNRASQICRKRIKEAFGWIKTWAGRAKVKVRGRPKVEAVFIFAAIADDLIRILKLMAECAP